MGAGSQQPAICLNMIVRNEAHVIREAFDSVLSLISSWVIVDTGSTDGTQDVVREYFAAHGIPGELHERPWRNFGANRTEALALAHGHGDYILVLDADDVLVGVPNLSNLTADGYHLRLGRDVVYWRPLLFRSTLEWEFRGVVHEYAACLAPSHTEAWLEGDYHIESRRLGDRNRAADKYERDRRLLAEELDRNPGDPRTVFYLAQSCFDAGDFAAALTYYTRRAEMTGWAEETYYALFRRGVCLERLGEPWAICQDAYLTAWQFRPARAEPLHAIATRHRLEGRPHQAYLFARQASEIPWPAAERLFLDADVYKWRSLDDRAVAAYHTGRYQESLEICDRLLDSPHLPDGERARVLSNRDFAAARLLEQDPPAPDAAAAAILARRAGHQSDGVTLTITTCRRRSLFARTMDSFLACCADLNRIDRWIVVDDGSSAADREWMAARYPFCEFVWKTRAEKGHARSMNLILDRLDTPYWLHLEDDWQFFVVDRYVTKALAILEDDPSLGQVLFNCNYGETLESRRVVGGIVRKTGGQSVRYRLHEHYTPGSPEYDAAMDRLPPGAQTMYYWPHYSLRPSLARVSAIRDIGRFNQDADHFEHEFALRFTARGYRSAFFDAITSIHIGRLTTERGPDATPNAYDLNAEPQFAGVRTERPRRVKIVRSPEAPAVRGLEEAESGAEWDGISITDDSDADYVVVLGDPNDGPLTPDRCIAFLPDSTEAGADAPALSSIDRRAFVQVRTRDAYASDAPFLQTVARIIHGRERLERISVRVINLERRPDRWAAFRQAVFKHAGVFVARCERVPAVDGQLLTLTPEIRHTFRGNDFNFRRGIIGCALSHLAVWREAARASTTTLILEDDVRLHEDFLGRLAEVCGLLRERHADADVVLLGYIPWTDEQRAAVTARRPLGLHPIDWSWFLGGTFAYLLSPHGARRLLDLVKRDGIQNGIDWFVMRKAGELKVLQTLPHLVEATLAIPGRSGDSDIQHDFVPVPPPPAPETSSGSIAVEVVPSPQPASASNVVPAAAPTRTIRVKLICDWCTPEQLCREWDHMSKGNFRWNDLEVTWEDRDVDFYAIVNRPLGGEHFDPARTIVFQMEPWCGNEWQTWGVKTWGEWSRPDPARFLQVRTHERFVNNGFWQLRSNYWQLKWTRPIKTKGLAAICSSKYFDPGHIARVDFLRYIEDRDDDVVQVDIYGYDNQLGFRNYLGPHPPGQKDAGLVPYKYFFAAENNAERNFITEKLWEPLLTETLCFYAGCPNAGEHIDPRAFIPLDLSDFDKAFDVMKTAMLSNQWEERLDVIRQQKERVLEHLQFFPTLERILQHELRMPFRPSDDDVAYHKYFHGIVGTRIQTACFVHSATFRGDTRILRRLMSAISDSGLLDRLDCLYVVNVGDPIAETDIGVESRNRVHVVNYSPDVTHHEAATLGLVRRFARAHRDARILYLHTKGASLDPPSPHVADWTDYLLYFMVERHQSCLAALDDHEVVGCNRLETPVPHFSGNFWWATAQHLAGLPEVAAGDRHAAEWWVLGRPGTRSQSLWDSGIDHYRQSYPRDRYARSASRV